MSLLDIVEAKRALAFRLRAWADDPAEDYLKASSFIDDLVARGWQMNPSRESRPQPPRSHEACTVCGYHLDRCICGNQATRPTAPGNPAAGAAACRAALRKEEA